MTTLNRTDRVLSIDIIRGFALLGIFLVNVPVMPDAMTVDSLNNSYIKLFYDIFIQTKFYVIFSFLFGVSAYYFLRAQERKGLAYKKLFWKRAGWLFVFGALHYIFIWNGDILHNYALVGFALPLVYKMSPRKIMVVAGIVYIFAFGMVQLPMIQVSFNNYALEGKTIEWGIPEESADEGYLSEVKSRAEMFFGLPFPLTVYLTKIISSSEFLALALFGFALAKMKFFEEFSRYKKNIKRIAIAAFILALPISIFIVKDFINEMAWSNYFYVWLSGQFLSIVYVTVFLCACEREQVRKKLAPLASYGKMAFTNYLMQSIVTVFIVVPLIPDFTRVTQVIYCLIFLTIQVYISTIIMKKYKYGPFEFVWRKLVFGIK